MSAQYSRTVPSRTGGIRRSIRRLRRRIRDRRRRLAPGYQWWAYIATMLAAITTVGLACRALGGM